MRAFVRYPHTPHLLWLGSGVPRGDKILSEEQATEMLRGPVVVEEKVDGANIGLSVGESGEIRVQNRGGYLRREHAHPQFGPLWAWSKAREAALAESLGKHLILFGEWCYAVHTVRYDRLPDWFLGFDVFDRKEAGFWDTARRDNLLSHLGLRPVPRIAKGRITRARLSALIGISVVGREPMEGIVARQEGSGRTLLRAKVVREAFTQAIQDHWSRKPLRPNGLHVEAAAWR